MSIDYGTGQTNIDKKTGIRFGVQAINSLSPYVWEDLEADYGEPSCPKCGNPCKEASSEEFAAEFAEHWAENVGNVYQNFSPEVRAEKMESALDSIPTKDYYCLDCAHGFCSDEAFSEPLGYTYDAAGIVCESAFDNTELFVTKSPYFTFAPFCSPCAPGACSADQGTTDPEDQTGGKCYCLPEDWFDDENPCPYCYWSVQTGELVYRPARCERCTEPAEVTVETSAGETEKVCKECAAVLRQNKITKSV